MYILFFSFLAAGATVLGGGIPLLNKRLNDKHLTLLVAFSAGVLLSTGLNHMLVESYAEAGRWAMIAVSLGFILLYGYEKLAMVHACREQGCEVHQFGGAALVGLGFHSFLDGFAIAVSFEFEKTLGILVIAAVILHRLPTGISTASIMLSNHYHKTRAWWTLTTIGVLAILGATLGLLLPMDETFLLSLAVGLSGGTFLYISTSDLLPMAHVNNQDYRVPLCFLLGFLGVVGTSFLY
ncbi:ZIP family metal transporter [candidate division KSB1 bacterium]|nr:ZIP family metal transporter [candidate division KSB1 bacterium]NIR69302.1 ZIP family metal transporter [candidate division KSB1 bacterium]NIS22708.1 ZIP family metal transporter [candidate division KSB1 bacterium]NIT69554.1 ZIP family metal transporter [candidate division KSB1 bacterium]NIU23208.1 ZIP family metal transporter [candidate division KSB1 bacterium]